MDVWHSQLLNTGNISLLATTISLLSGCPARGVGRQFTLRLCMNLTLSLKLGVSRLSFGSRLAGRCRQHTVELRCKPIHARLFLRFAQAI